MDDIDWLLKYVDSRFEAADRAVAAALAAAKEAVAKSDSVAEKRADASNEIRGAMVDAQKHFADKDQTDFRLTTLEKQLASFINKATGIIAFIALIATIIGAWAKFG